MRIDAGRIIRIATYLTGELFAALRKHSILGRLMPDTEDGQTAPDLGAFELDMATAQQSGPGDFAAAWQACGSAQ